MTIGEKIALKFRKAWNKNNYSMSDGKSIEIWIKNEVDSALQQQEEPVDTPRQLTPI